MNKRYFVAFPLDGLPATMQIKKQVLIWLRRFSTCCFLDSSEFRSPGVGFDCIAAAGRLAGITLNSGNAFANLRHFSSLHDDWLFGHFSFSLKSETDQVTDQLPGSMSFPDGFFFVPDTVVIVDDTHLRIGCPGPSRAEDEIRQQAIYQEILGAVSPEALPTATAVIRERMNRDEYLDVIRQLLVHIKRGDCYEINYCQEFFAENSFVDPFQLFQQLTDASPAPFGAFYRLENQYLLCASPERYLRREGQRVFSQPIKGTAPRYPGDPEKDRKAKEMLAASVKDQTENVMIVDLVRNDLSRFCVADSVRVDELFGIYSFAQVHQMISTISGQPAPDLDWTEMIRKSFPMGSMTGAPKRRVLELIGKYEKTRRGLFSGAVGYVNPERNFDFNVVIRSLFYDSGSKYLGWFAGSGITAASDPEAEYEECLVKVAAIRELLRS